MGNQFAIFNKCRACLSPETVVEFIHLTGPNAEMFKVVTGIELPIESDKSDSMICPDCFSELERLHNFKVMSKQAEIFFKLKRRLAPVLEKCNEEAKQATAATVLTKPQNDPSTASIECGFVVEGFENKGERRTPMRKHASELKFCCSKCGFEFKSQHGLLKHSRSKRIYKCAVCDVKFSCKLLLDHHQNEFHGNVFKCDQCSYQTKIKQSLLLHKGTHDKSIVCDTCPKKFSTDFCLKLHQMQHRHGIYTTTPAETFDCDKCGKSFSSSRYLKVHEKQVHDEKEVKCEVCEKIFRNRSLLHHHSRTHFKVECSICKKMVTKRIFAFHLSLHSAARTFKCDRCGFSTKTKKHLKTHNDRVHLLRSLAEHKSSATSCEMKFKCAKCGKSFATPHTLKQHKKTVHPHILFECEICKKTFKTKATMKRHRTKLHSKK